ncbi:MAG TPA: AbrB/MazE/SpoVT family DNA-binding domain-containing protein [Candidatus Acidoferrum sp.]|jgi:AbrB family looped-hinge helix DNA binding protein
MQTKVSTKGQVVLPSPIRNKLGLRPGDSLDASIESGRVVLTPRKIRPKKVRIIPDPVTGLPVMDLGRNAKPLTSKQVSEILADFP